VSKSGSCVAANGGTESSDFICFEDELKSLRFDMRVNDRIFLFRWTIPLNQHLLSIRKVF